MKILFLFLALPLFAASYPPEDKQFKCDSSCTCLCRYAEVHMCLEGWQYTLQGQYQIWSLSKELAEERAQNLLSCGWNYYKSELTAKCED